MPFDDLIILIPCHSLEDFPSELPDTEAASLLNAFAIPWHPALLASARALPRWQRADEPPETAQQRLMIVPTCCESWLPPGFTERAEEEGSTVVRGLSERNAMLAEALQPLEPLPAIDAELAADFLALGSCYLQIELLTRKMRNFSNLDEVHLQREAVAAAEAALAGDDTTARTRLRSCFEVLTEARERFYPVDCYLLDLCLLIPRLADQHLVESLLNLKPMSVLATAADLQEIATASPEIHESLREAWDRATAEIVTGEWKEAPTPLLPLPSVIWQFQKGIDTVEQLFQRRPRTWGRRRYGLFSQLPQILKKFGFEAALHVALDDGIYPDEEYTKTRWEGDDGSVVETLTRIPLAAETAVSYLRFPTRMSESMDNDHVAGVVFARWPEIKTPWFDDFRRMHNYSPVLGRFVTLADFFENTDSPGRLSNYKAGEYLTPFLLQAVAYEEENPVSRYSRHVQYRQQFDNGRWYAAMTQVLQGKSLVTDSAEAELEEALETLGETPLADTTETVASQVAAFEQQAAGQLAKLIMTGAGPQPGYLILNPLGFRRRVTVTLPGDGPPPNLEGTDAWLQWEGDRRCLTTDVPGAGFTWFPCESTATPSAAPASNVPLAEANVLRNEFFEVYLSEKTGGIQQIKGHGRSPNRLSQQLTYRFPRERTFTVGEGPDAEEIRSAYAEMRADTSEVTCSGPACGEIVTTGTIVDQKTQERLAGFRQTCRVWRSRPIVELIIDLEVNRQPEADPWNNYFGARFAWNDDTASLTRGVMYGAHEVTTDRMESPHYLEIARDEQRTTILPFGLPFHRKSGPRMLDTILKVPREHRRQFRFVIAIDQQFPMQAALDALTPPAVIATTNGPPTSGRTGWFFHLNTRNAQVLGVLPLLEDNASGYDIGIDSTSPPPTSGQGCTLRLVETEGRPTRARLRCFRPPVRARQRNFLGKTIYELTIDGDSVLVDLTAHEIADIELRFD